MKNADRCLAQLFIPINLNKLRQENELHIYDAYSHGSDGKQSGNSIMGDIGTCKQTLASEYLLYFENSAYNAILYSNSRNII